MMNFILEKNRLLYSNEFQSVSNLVTNLNFGGQSNYMLFVASIRNKDNTTETMSELQIKTGDNGL